MTLHVGFVSTRFAGLDGVSLEAAKWCEVIEALGHRCFWFAGESSRDGAVSLLEPRAHFKTPLNDHINRWVYHDGEKRWDPAGAIREEKTALARSLRRFIRRFRLDVLIVENALSIPMQIPLGLALLEVLKDTGIPAIAHHHDFYWERSRFHLNGYADLIQRTFPPDLPNVRHLVINTRARQELLARTGIPAEVVPNIMDFGNPPRVNEGRSQGLRRELGLGPGDIMVLQPTRMVPRKGVETTLEIVRRLGPKRCKLVVPHGLDDEGPAYHRGIAERCEASGIDLRCIHDRVTDPLESPEETGRGGYSLWDVYHACDIVAYPSRKEGFGNAFLEAVYTRKPIVVNRYEIYVRDIEPKGFDVIPLDEGRVTGEVMDGIHAVLTDPARRSGMVETNYRIAREWFSYDCLAERLSGWLSDASGG